MTRPRKIETENHVKTLVKEWFDAHGGWSYAPVQNGLGVHGIPDRVGCIPVTITQAMVGRKLGVFIGIECKKPGRRSEANRGLSTHQQLVLDAIYDARGWGIVCDGVEDLGRLGNPYNWLRT